MRRILFFDDAAQSDEKVKSRFNLLIEKAQEYELVDYESEYLVNIFDIKNYEPNKSEAVISSEIKSFWKKYDLVFIHSSTQNEVHPSIIQQIRNRFKKPIIITFSTAAISNLEDLRIQRDELYENFRFFLFLFKYKSLKVDKFTDVIFNHKQHKQQLTNEMIAKIDSEVKSCIIRKVDWKTDNVIYQYKIVLRLNGYDDNQINRYLHKLNKKAPHVFIQELGGFKKRTN